MVHQRKALRKRRAFFFVQSSGKHNLMHHRGREQLGPATHSGGHKIERGSLRSLIGRKGGYCPKLPHQIKALRKRRAFFFCLVFRKHKPAQTYTGTALTSRRLSSKEKSICIYRGKGQITRPSNQANGLYGGINTALLCTGDISAILSRAAAVLFLEFAVKIAAVFISDRFDDGICGHAGVG